MTTDPLPILWLCGAPAAGKSVTAWGLYERRRADGVAYVDVDQLKMLFPETCDRGVLGARCLAVLARLHRHLGTRALVVSGVIEPHELAVVEQAVADDAVVDWLLLDADEATLRARISARGWPDDLADLVVADALALRGAGIERRVDTGVVDVDGAVRAAASILHLRPGAAPTALGPVARADDVVVIYGPRAVGKSTVSWQLFMACQQRDEPTGYLDADQLGFVESPGRDALVLHAITGLASVFRRAGSVRTIVNGCLSPALAARLSEAGATLVRLDASDDTLRERIAARHGGSPARLAGDDLEGADASTQAAVLAEAQRQRSEHHVSDLVTHALDTNGADVGDLVDAVAALLPARVAP